MILLRGNGAKSKDQLAAKWGHRPALTPRPLPVQNKTQAGRELQRFRCVGHLLDWLQATQKRRVFLRRNTWFLGTCRDFLIADENPRSAISISSAVHYLGTDHLVGCDDCADFARTTPAVWVDRGGETNTAISV